MVPVEALMPAVETPLFLPSGDHQLFAVLHEPDSEARMTPFVFCHAFGEEKLWAHRVFVDFARRLSSRGYPVLRVDCRGNGDSSGEFSETSLTTNLADLGTAIDWLKARRNVARVGLLGLRLGATEAALLAEGRDDVSTLVLWNPIVDGARYMQELLRINLTTQLATSKAITHDREALLAQMRAGQTVNIDGYELALPFHEQVSAIRLGDQLHAFGGRCLLVQIERNAAAQPMPELVRLQERLAAATLRVVSEEPFWREIQRFYEATDELCNATLQWLEGA
jgi:exosortase A-associated hydrolase 2